MRRSGGAGRAQCRTALGPQGLSQAPGDRNGGDRRADRLPRPYAGVVERVGRGMDRKPHGNPMSRALRQLQLPFDVSPQAEKAGRARQVRLAGGILRYNLVRARRRTIALFVEGEGVEARAPRYATVAEIEAFIREKERWIRRRLAEPRRRPLAWEAGASLPWLGRTVTLALRHGEIGVWLSEDRFELGLADGASLRERALDWMRTQALEFFRERVAELVRLRGLRVLAVGLSNARTRWGSCGSNGRILLNWRLMMLPPH